MVVAGVGSDINAPEPDVVHCSTLASPDKAFVTDVLVLRIVEIILGGTDGDREDRGGTEIKVTGGHQFGNMGLILEGEEDRVLKGNSVSTN